MKSGPTNGGSFIQRWLSRSSNASAHASYGGSDVDSRTTDSFTPPPLTDSSSTTESSSITSTPKVSPVYSSRKQPPSRFAVVKTPCTPPTKYAELPPVQTSRKLAVSLPPNTQRPSALVVARPSVKLHRLLSYTTTRRPIIWDIISPTSYIRQPPPPSFSNALVSRRHPIPSSHTFSPPPTVPEQDLSQYSTTPPVTRMRIICDLIPWSIHVRGRSTMPDDPNSFVRVIDVVETIHKSLRIGVSNGEWNIAPKAFRDRVKKAYLARCARARAYTLEGYEEKQGVRRVDWFLDRTMFWGLMINPPGVEGNGRPGSIGACDESTWVLMVEPR